MPLHDTFGMSETIDEPGQPDPDDPSDTGEPQEPPRPPDGFEPV